MSGFKNPSFQDRIGSAAEAKNKALEQLRAKPAPDEKVLAERQARRSERDARAAEKAEAKKAAKAAEAAAQAAVPAPLTDEEKKAARDAKYAARKARR